MLLLFLFLVTVTTSLSKALQFAGRDFDQLVTTLTETYGSTPLDWQPLTENDILLALYASIPVGAASANLNLDVSRRFILQLQIPPENSATPVTWNEKYDLWKKRAGKTKRLVSDVASLVKTGTGLNITHQFHNLGALVVEIPKQPSQPVLDQQTASWSAVSYTEMLEEISDILSRIPYLVDIEAEVPIYASGWTQTQYRPPWHLDRVDSKEGGFDGKYTFAWTGKDVHVYVVDSGITPHQEFGNRLWYNESYSYYLDSIGPKDVNGHGTHVAGILAGNSMGVAKEAFIHSVRVLDSNGTGTSLGLYEGVNFVLDNELNYPVRQGRYTSRDVVVNMSLGGPASTSLDRITGALFALDIPVIVAAGNDQQSACKASPSRACRLGYVYTVGSSTTEDARSEFSNYECVNIFAPGETILSASSINEKQYKSLRGTSQATPIVAGAAALILEAYPNSTAREIYALLNGSCSVSGRISDSRSSSTAILYIGISSCLPERNQSREALEFVELPTDSPDWWDSLLSWPYWIYVGYGLAGLVFVSLSATLIARAIRRRSRRRDEQTAEESRRLLEDEDEEE